MSDWTAEAKPWTLNAKDKMTAALRARRQASDHIVVTPVEPPPDPVDPPAGGFPNPASTGVPKGWTPKQTQSTDLRATNRGQVIEDVLLTPGGNLIAAAPDVTFRRCYLKGGAISNWPGGPVQNGMTVEDTTIEPRPGHDYECDSEGVVSYGGYTARRVCILRRGEGFRCGAKGGGGATTVTLEDCFASIVQGSSCAGDPHNDGIQGYDGPPIVIRNVTIDFKLAAAGTAPFFYPANQGNTSVDIENFLVMYGGYPFRCGMPGRVKGLRVVDKSWHYGVVDCNGSLLTEWEAKTVEIDANYQVTREVADIPLPHGSGT